MIAAPNSGCTILNLYVLDPPKNDVNKALSLLISAMDSGLKVDIQVWDDYCMGGRPVIRRIRIHK